MRAQRMRSELSSHVTVTDLSDDRKTEQQVLDSSQTTIKPPYSIFTAFQKRTIILGAAMASLFSPITGQIYLPALELIAKDMGITSSQVNLTITTYMIFQGITPMLIGPFADNSGRRPAYIICFSIYIAANIGLALAPNYASLLWLRGLQSAGSSTTSVLCTAVMADLATSAERGQYVSYTVVPAALAPTLGPVLGGLLAHFLGWRSIFWSLAIASSVTIILVVIFFPETCRHIVGNGSIYPPPLYRSIWQTLKRRQAKMGSGQGSNAEEHLEKGNAKLSVPNVLKSLIMLMEKKNAAILWPSSLAYAIFYGLGSAVPSLFSESYAFDEIRIGLMYVPMAMGSILAAGIIGPIINWNFRRHCSKQGVPYDISQQQDLSSFPVERARLEVALPLVVVAGVSMVAWGWAIHFTAHVALICILGVSLGFCMIGYCNASKVMLLDINPGKAATVIAAHNLTRCAAGAGAAAAIAPLLKKISVGWTFSMLGVLFVFGMWPLLLLMRQRGEAAGREGRGGDGVGK